MSEVRWPYAVHNMPTMRCLVGGKIDLMDDLVQKTICKEYRNRLEYIRRAEFELGQATDQVRRLTCNIEHDRNAIHQLIAHAATCGVNLAELNQKNH